MNQHAPATTRPLRPRPSTLAVALALAFSAPVMALPSGEQVVAGKVTVQRPDSRNLVVNQGSRSAIVNWQDFSIPAGDSVVFRQPDASSVILNRVVGNDPSAIYGTLSANGRVFLVNPAGVLFGRGASVNVGSLVASTLDIGDADFLAGRYRFAARAGTAGSVTNEGRLTAGERGTVALLGAEVRNDGTVTARLGTVALAAGDKVSLDFAGDGLTKVRVDAALARAAIANSGALSADGGQVLLTARAADALASTVINQSGVIEARSLVSRGGRVVLDGGDQGVTEVSGRIDVSGGTAGSRGGSVQILGQDVALVGTASVDASGNAGGGTVQVGGGRQGLDPAVRNADAVWVGADTRISADALGQGSGGQVIVWSRDATRAYGTISARGAGSGNGGFVETSGHYLDSAGIRVNVGAPGGKAGEWLLDPVDVTITAGPTSNAGSAPNFTATASPSVVAAGDIANALNSGGSVSVSTSVLPPASDPGEAGNITVNAPITMTGAGTATLTLNAHNDIVVNADITSTGGRLNLNLNADSDASGQGAVSIGSSIAVVSLLTNGGDLRIYGGSNPVNGFATSGPNGTWGVALQNAVLDTRGNGGSGAMSIRGQGGSYGGGVEIAGSELSSDAGISVVGVSTTGTGIQVSDSSLSGATVVPTSTTIDGGSSFVRLYGQGGFAGVSTFSEVNPVLIQSSAGGSVDIRGLGGSVGVTLGDRTTVATSGGPGLIRIAGQALGAVGNAGVVGLNVSPFATIGGPDTTGDIVLMASAPATVDAIRLGNSDLPATVQTSGTLNLRPSSVAAFDATQPFALDAGSAIPITIQGAGTGFDLSSQDLASLVPGFSRIVVGGNGQTGAISVDAATAVMDNLTLQSSGGITLNADLDVGNADSQRTLTLAASAGSVTQPGGRLTADRLLLSGGGTFDLSNGANLVNVVALQGVGSATYYNSGPLNIDNVSGGGWNGAAEAPQALAATTSTATGYVLIRSMAGDLGLGHPLTSSTGAVDLVSAGIFNNYGGAQLTAPVYWRVWASTWVGETRGPLAPSHPNPNFYGCDFDAGCSWGGVVPTSGQRFVYVAQPSVLVTPAADPYVRAVGEPNPPFPANVSGVMTALGDTPADAVSGQYTTSLTPATPPGLYVGAVRWTPPGKIISPTGYLVETTRGNLLIDNVSHIPPLIYHPIDQPTFIYARNMDVPGLCIPTGPLSAGRGIEGADTLAVEWTRVREQPRLSNCVDLAERHTCSDF